MDYGYERQEPYEARVLWGRIAFYGVAFLLLFLLGMWIGRLGAASPGEIVELEQQVRELAAENERLEERIAAMGADDDRPRVGDEEEPAEPEPAPEQAPPEEPRTYIVQPGDNLYGIALEMYGDGSKFRLIAEANDIDSSNPLTVGQELVIPPEG